MHNYLIAINQSKTLIDTELADAILVVDELYTNMSSATPLIYHTVLIT